MSDKSDKTWAAITTTLFFTTVLFAIANQNSSIAFAILTFTALYGWTKEGTEK